MLVCTNNNNELTSLTALFIGPMEKAKQLGEDNVSGHWSFPIRHLLLRAP